MLGETNIPLPSTVSSDPRAEDERAVREAVERLTAERDRAQGIMAGGCVRDIPLPGDLGPDPRDARIAALEDLLRKVHPYVGRVSAHAPSLRRYIEDALR